MAIPSSSVEFVKYVRAGLSKEQIMEIVAEHDHEQQCELCVFISDFCWIDTDEYEGIEEIEDVVAWSLFEFLSQDNPESFDSEVLTECLRILELDLGLTQESRPEHAAWQLGLHASASSEQLDMAAGHYAMWLGLMKTQREGIGDDEILETLFRVANHPNANSELVEVWVERIHDDEWSGHEEYSDEGYEFCELCQKYLSETLGER